MNNGPDLRGLRIVYLNPAGAIGGAERILLYVMGGVRKALPEAQVHLIVSGEGPLIREAEALGVPTRLLPLPRSLV
jgi:hypothetical protein